LLPGACEAEEAAHSRGVCLLLLLLLLLELRVLLLQVVLQQWHWQDHCILALQLLHGCASWCLLQVLPP
jgi:hypothetical protein